MSSLREALTAVIDVLGQEVTVNGQKTVGVFSETYREVDPGGVMVATRRPNLLVNMKLLEREPRQDDLVEIEGHAFRVINVEPDGAGGALLELHEQ